MKDRFMLLKIDIFLIFQHQSLLDIRSSIAVTATEKTLPPCMCRTQCTGGSVGGISDVRMSGPGVLENGRQQHVDLGCSFSFASAEFKQLDIKWYFDNQVT